MKLHLPKELEAPEKSHIFVCIVYGAIAFFSVPFLVLLISDGYHNDAFALSWFEIAFHVLNFWVIFLLFREYLTDSLLNMQLNKDAFISTVAIGAGISLVIGIIWHFLFLFTGNGLLWLAGFGTIPLSELDIMVLSGDMVIANPIFGTLCMVLLVPVVTGCLYYAVGFVPFYNIRPWLGYLVICFVVAFPRVCSAVTYWAPLQEAALYVAQLPVHLTCCWAYQKTDTVWAPIGVQMVVNLIASVALILLYR